MKTEYRLSKHRFYELKHFCLQYPEWEALYSKSDGWAEETGKNKGDTTSRHGIRRADLAYKMELIREAAQFCRQRERDIFEYVTSGKYSGRTDEEFWHYYRIFFWELAKLRS